ncbi:MAG: hypothetical protein VKP62_02025 [Candidatus Sericytochromatia bacterium]|nr:hypothetical protein [Candidatus Sericytochromatia bacterium]
MQSFWVSVSYDKELVLSHCFPAETREAALESMLNYLRLEFDLPAGADIKVAQH